MGGEAPGSQGKSTPSLHRKPAGETYLVVVVLALLRLAERRV
jgi:hypothetical protein